MDEPTVVFEGVSLRSPGGRAVFEEIDWKLPRGGRARLSAERGVGSSAVLRLCAGLAHAQQGRVLLDGVAHEPHGFTHPFLRRGALAWVPQDGDLVANLTLLQNVALPLRFVRGLAREEAEPIAAAMLERLGLAEHSSARPHHLVRRERRLGALARSAVMRAELWLLDRTFDGLEGRSLELALAVLDEALDEPSTDAPPRRRRRGGRAARAGRRAPHGRKAPNRGPPMRFERDDAKVGLLVLAALALFISLALHRTLRVALNREVVHKVRLENVADLPVGTEVQLGGLRVGQVKAIEMERRGVEYRFVATLGLRPDIVLWRGTKGVVNSRIMGQSYPRPAAPARRRAHAPRFRPAR